MLSHMQPRGRRVTSFCVLSLCVVARAVEPPYLRTVDNLDEPEGLSFCLDLKGWNPPTFVDVQAHSCKPSSGGAGGGSDERFEAVDGAIKGFGDADTRCLQAQSAAANAGFDTPTCDASNSLQQFCYDTDGTLKLSSDLQLCVVVSPAMRQANSFWARDLYLDNCDGVETKHKAWQQVTSDNQVLTAGPGCSGTAPTADACGAASSCNACTAAGCFWQPVGDPSCMPSCNIADAACYGKAEEWEAQCPDDTAPTADACGAVSSCNACTAAGCFWQPVGDPSCMPSCNIADASCYGKAEEWDAQCPNDSRTSGSYPRVVAILLAAVMYILVGLF